MPSPCQGIPNRSSVIRLTDPSPAPEPFAQLKSRILEIVGAEESQAPPVRSLGRDGRRGLRRWWGVRAFLGGRVCAAEMRRAVDALLAEGELLEVWLKPRGQRDAPHLLVLPGIFWAQPVQSVQGRADRVQEYLAEHREFAREAQVTRVGEGDAADPLADPERNDAADLWPGPSPWAEPPARGSRMSPLALQLLGQTELH